MTRAGSGVAAAWEALEAGAAAGRQWHPDDAPETFLAAPIPDDYRANADIPRNLVHFLDRGSLIALDAALQALASAGLGAGAGDARRFAVCDGLPYRVPGQSALFVPYGHAIARVLGVRGPAISVAGAEASGMAAIAAAARTIARNEADVVLAGAGQALQAPLCEHLHAQGFASRSSARPFDSERSGFVPAEAAAYVVLESAAHARLRGATILGALAGIAETFDSTAEPLETSDPAEAGRSMQAALGDAGYLQNQVDLLISCAGGRDTLDHAEGSGAMRTFGRHAYYAGVTTIAGALGFPLAASGPLSVAMAIEAIRRQRVFPIAGLETCEEGLELAFVREARDEKLDCVLVTSLGLGGTNVAAVLAR